MEQPIDLVRQKNKPFLVYECGDYQPNPYKIEFAARMLAFAVQQDADGIFWFCWDDNSYLPDLSSDQDYAKRRLPMPDASYPNAGLIHANDEVMLAALKSAGAVFMYQGLTPKTAPLTMEFGNDFMFQMDPKADRTLENIQSLLRPYAWGEGLRVCYNPGLAVTRLPDKKTVQGTSIDIGGLFHADWSNQKGSIKLDEPGAKIYAGLCKDNQITFKGVKFEEITRDWVWVGMVAADGQELQSSANIIVTLVSRSMNTGLQLDPVNYSGAWASALGSAVKNPGQLPIQVERVSAKIQSPWLKGKEYAKYNFLRECYEQGKIEDQSVTILPGEELFYMILSEKNAQDILSSEAPASITQIKKE